MSATHIAELDAILDSVSDLAAAASEDGLDEQATTLEEVLETLRGIDLSNGADDGADGEGADPCR